MVEFRVANYENGVEEYFSACHENLQNSRKFYNLYINGEKKNNTLYIFNVSDFTIDCEKMLMELGTDKEVKIEKGYILCHKMVEDNCSKHLSSAIVLIDCNDGHILYEK